MNKAQSLWLSWPLLKFLWPYGVLTILPNRTRLAWVACLATVFFAIGMALWGTSRYAGHFYVISLLLGTPVFLATRAWRSPVARSVQVYGLFYAGFFVMCVIHVAFRDAHPGTIEYSARFLLGWMNGFFFFQIFSGDRKALFQLIAVVAGAHLTVAVGYTLYAGFDFVSVAVLGVRPGGNTNPIPYSFLILSSAGLVALALADQVRRDRKFLLLGAIALTLAGSLIAIAVTGTRGTLIAFPLLLVLIASLLWLRAGAAWSLGLMAIGLLVFLVVAATVFQREPTLLLTTWGHLVGDESYIHRATSTGQRYDLWIAAMRLIPEQPVFGFGFSSMPEVLHHPAAGVPADSIIHGYGHTHNEYLDILLKAGIVGAVLFYGPMVVALWIAWFRLREPVLQVCALSVIWLVGAQLVYGITSVMFAHASTILQFGVYLGMLVFALSHD